MHRARRGIVVACLLLLPPVAIGAPLASAQSDQEVVSIYLAAIGDGGERGDLFGCNDSSVPVDAVITTSSSVESRIRSTLRELLVIDDEYYGQSGLYNALLRSNLFVDDVTVSNGSALIELSGTLALGGTCDDPRVIQQIKQTVLQFSEVNGVAILLNGDWMITNARGAECFDATGHCVANEFLQFWEANGGLPIFGYPVSDLRVEDGHVVQYFERQRFEYHPGYGQPFMVLLGRLGAEAAEERGLVGDWAFLPYPEDSPPREGCHFFPSTGHYVCGALMAHWSSYGLEFGDQGVSFDESLHLFGYPISDAFDDPQSGLTVQYFERAIFQWHPENQPPWNVLLERLGADAAAKQAASLTNSSVPARLSMIAP